ncbi:MEKHLA domain-containing protein [Shewanella surugensis]|uniref:MEKHLA domain-containing protein n=1 Tax=Shewanella surugensis TaxID=212020 RepID=A0ABT0LA52_9GAMM|nr:MEKHLA domain-containing protein [Shewanella surugensis]MCL1124520.1 MEKHLA domain-containing protein [Shewanella surugensis]
MNDSCPLEDAFYVAHGERLLESFKRLMDFDLLIGNLSISAISALDQAPVAILSHGIEAEPIFNFGNQFALTLFECEWRDFIKMPSRYSAEVISQEERAGLLAKVSRQGFIVHYHGVRVSATGKRFMINNAIVWNIIDHQGQYHGQAAMFKDYSFL